MSDRSCCFVQGDQGLPGEQGVPGDRGVGEAGPKVKTLHCLKLVRSDNNWCMQHTRSTKHKWLLQGEPGAAGIGGLPGLPGEDGAPGQKAKLNLFWGKISSVEKKDFKILCVCVYIYYYFYFFFTCNYFSFLRGSLVFLVWGDLRELKELALRGKR